MAQKKLKRPNEVVRYGFDFSNKPQILAGAVLQGTPTITVNGPGGLTVGTAAIESGTFVRATFSVGTTDKTYQLSCDCPLNDSVTVLTVIGDLFVSARGNLP